MKKVFTSLTEHATNVTAFEKKENAIFKKIRAKITAKGLLKIIAKDNC